MFRFSPQSTLLSPKSLHRVLTIIFLATATLFGQARKAPAPASGAQASTAYREALNLLKNNQGRQALAVIHSGLVENPSDWQLYDLQGLAESSMGNREGAEASFRKVIELAPTRALGYADMGVLMFQMGQAEKLWDYSGQRSSVTGQLHGAAGSGHNSPGIESGWRGGRNARHRMEVESRELQGRLRICTGVA